MTLRLSEAVIPVYQGEFWKTKKTYVACKGSRGSGKSKQTALWHIFQMMKLPLSNTLVVRKVERTLRDSCYADLKWAIHRLGVDRLWRCTTNPLEIIYIPTGQKIMFRGLDDPFKITSISVPIGVLNFLWIEEFYEIGSEDDFDTLNESIRGQLPEGYWKRVTMTFNPWNERHFSKRRFFDAPSPDVLAMTTTYMDNPYLSDTDRALFEEMKAKNPKRFRVAGLGEWGIAEGTVYENWEEQAFDISKIRTLECVRSAFGLDFGYTNDPTALFCGLIDETAKTIWVFDEMYERGMSNERIYEMISSMGYAKEKITADSAEPKSIDRLYDLGLTRIKGAHKGRDSVNNGIDYIQDFHIIVHPRCVNFITEISSYSWAKDKDGRPTNRPEDDFNHLMDAMRYAMEDFSSGETYSFD